MLFQTPIAVEVKAGTTLSARARHAFDLARCFSSGTARLDPAEWSATVWHPSTGVFEFHGPFGMTLLVRPDGRASRMIAEA